MPTPEPQEVLAAFSRLIGGVLNTRPELSGDLATIAEWVARLARGHAAGDSGRTQSAHSIAPIPAPTRAAPIDSPVIITNPVTLHTPAVFHGPRVVQRSAIVPLRIGDTQIHVPVLGSTVEIGQARQSAMHDDAHPHPADHSYDAGSLEPDLSMIARRCALKAASCAVVLLRETATAGSPEEHAHISEIGTLITQAKTLPTCFLWAPYRQAPLPPHEIVELCARAYENLALMAALTERVHGDPSLRRYLVDALELFAETQSALRIILEQTWLTRADQDQLDAFIWINRLARNEQIYLSRFLRLDDPADPADHARLNAAIRALSERVDGASKKSKDSVAAFNKLKYHVRRAVETPDETELAGLRAASDALALREIAHDDRRVREIVAPLAAMLDSGTQLGDYLTRAVRATQAQAAETVAAPREPRVYSADVQRVRDLLRGSVVVIAGGEPYAHARERLIEAFALGDLDWCVQSEHGSSSVFESPIARGDTRIVLVLVKLAGHQHIDDIRRWCKEYKKPMVMLTAGYNPEQVAAAVLEQAGERLSG